MITAVTYSSGMYRDGLLLDLEEEISFAAINEDENIIYENDYSLVIPSKVYTVGDFDINHIVPVSRIHVQVSDELDSRFSPEEMELRLYSQSAGANAASPVTSNFGLYDYCFEIPRMQTADVEFQIVIYDIKKQEVIEMLPVYIRMSGMAVPFIVADLDGNRLSYESHDPTQCPVVTYYLEKEKYDQIIPVAIYVDHLMVTQSNGAFSYVDGNAEYPLDVDYGYAPALALINTPSDPTEFAQFAQYDIYIKNGENRYAAKIDCVVKE